MGAIRINMGSLRRCCGTELATRAAQANLSGRQVSERDGRMVSCFVALQTERNCTEGAHETPIGRRCFLHGGRR